MSTFFDSNFTAARREREHCRKMLIHALKNDVDHTNAELTQLFVKYIDAERKSRAAFVALGEHT